MARPFTPATPEVFAKSLARRLVSTADRLRNLNTRFGLRAHSVKIIRTRWTGGRRDKGIEEIISEVELLPVPKVSGLGDLNHVLSQIGEQERGDVRLSDLSGSYTEDFLTGVDSSGAAIPSDQGFYYEITYLASGPTPQKRYFIPNGVPEYKPGQLRWVMTLNRVESCDPKRPGEF